jgi:hypothetical protein
MRHIDHQRTTGALVLVLLASPMPAVAQQFDNAAPRPAFDPSQARRKKLYIAGHASAQMKHELATRDWMLYENTRSTLYDIM